MERHKGSSKKPEKQQDKGLTEKRNPQREGESENVGRKPGEMDAPRIPDNAKPNFE